MTKKLDPDRPNKARRGRPPKPKKKSPFTKLWSDPETRPRMLALSAAGRAAQAIEKKTNPAKYSRYDIPNGMTRVQAARLWAKARRKADRFMQKMADEGTIPNPVIPDTDEAKGVAALNEAVVLALGPSEKNVKLAAIRTVLEYTRSKPESKSKLTLNTSEDFLAAIAAEDAEGK